MQINRAATKKEFLFYGDFVDALLMAAAFERRRKECFDDFDSLVVADKAPRHREHVCVIVLTCKACYFGNPAKRGADALVLVECDGDALAATADGNARIAFAAFHRVGGKVGKVGVIATIFAKSAKIFIGNTFTFKVLNHCLLGLPTGMVAAKRHRQTRFKN